MIGPHKAGKEEKAGKLVRITDDSATDLQTEKMVTSTPDNSCANPTNAKKQNDDTISEDNSKSKHCAAVSKPKHDCKSHKLM